MSELSELQLAGPSESKTKRRPEPLPTERTISLGRVLDGSWRDNASPLYDCFDAALREQEESVGPWLAHQKHQNENNAVLKAAEAKFAAVMDTLRAHGIAYDPRLPGPPPPLDGMSRAAQLAWQDLYHLRDEAARFEHILDGAAGMMQRDARRRLEAMREARALHVQFIAEAVRKAMRWRVLGRIVMYGLRWMHRALRGRGG